MEFDDLKVIWDSQNEEPLYAVNEDGLQAMLRKKAQAFKRLVFWQEAQTYGSTLFVLGVVSILLTGYFTGVLDRLRGNEMTSWDAVALFVGAGCWLQFGFNVWFVRIKQRKKERGFPATLRGELDRDIEQAEFEINSRRHLVRDFLPPYLGSGLSSLVLFRATGAEWMMIPLIVAMVLALVVETRCQRRLVTNKLIPRKEELESLRNKLASAEQ
jgi:hypothetical protein